MTERHPWLHDGLAIAAALLLLFVVALVGECLIPAHAQASYRLPDPQPTCQASADPESHTCLIAFVGTAQAGSTVLLPLANVTVHVGNQSVKTGKVGWVAVDILRVSQNEVKAIAPPGYAPDAGSLFEAKGSPVTAVRVLVPVK